MILQLTQPPPGKQQVLELAEGARAAVREAAREILEVYHSAAREQHHNKEDGSPVTAADRVADRILGARLAELTPGWPVISEEGENLLAPGPQGSPYWLVDPLDGTREFLAGTGEFTVNVALMIKAVPVWGAVGVPVDDRIYEGGKTLGSRIWRGMAPSVIRVAQASARQCRVPVSRSHPDAKTEAVLQQLEGWFEEVIRLPLGSSLKFCALAEGDADCYPRHGALRQWDLAAGQAVLEGAGGSVCRLRDGQPLRYGGDGSVAVAPFVALGEGMADWRGRFGWNPGP